MSDNVVRAAAVQAAPAFLDRDATIEKAVALIAEAASAGARIIAFPETWVPGYPAWIFGAAVWDDPAAKRVYARLQANAVEVPSRATDVLCAAARRAGACVVVGINERDARFSRGTLYNSQLFISAQGEILGVHRKLIPTHAERILWGQGDGSGLHVFPTPFGRVGGLVCWEHWMPLARFAMHAKGEQIHVAAWPDAPDTHHIASRHYAFEGRCFVICAASYLRSTDLPRDFELSDAMLSGAEDEGDDDEILPGGSGIIGPDGRWLAGPVKGREEIVVADLDLGRIAEEQQALDTAGHYNRPDVFQLTVDERGREQVAWLSDAARGAHEPDAASENGASAAARGVSPRGRD